MEWMTIWSILPVDTSCWQITKFHSTNCHEKDHLHRKKVTATATLRYCEILYPVWQCCWKKFLPLPVRPCISSGTGSRKVAATASDISCILSGCLVNLMPVKPMPWLSVIIKKSLPLPVSQCIVSSSPIKNVNVTDSLKLYFVWQSLWKRYCHCQQDLVLTLIVFLGKNSLF